MSRYLPCIQHDNLCLPSCNCRASLLLSKAAPNFQSHSVKIPSILGDVFTDICFRKIAKEKTKSNQVFLCLCKCSFSLETSLISDVIGRLYTTEYQ